MIWQPTYNTTGIISDNNIDGNIFPPFSGDTESKDFGGLFLPIAIRVAAKTIGLDLVSVQPMESPLDYEAQKRKRIRKERKNKIEELFPEFKDNE